MDRGVEVMMRGANDDVLLHALVVEGAHGEGPSLAVEMVWLAARDRVEVRAFDLAKPPTERPFYSEDAERVKDAELLWAEATGAARRLRAGGSS